MRIWKIALMAAVIALPMVCGVYAEAAIYTGASHSVNNDVTNEDYKLTDEEVEKLHKLLLMGPMSAVQADESEKYRVQSPKRSIKTNVADSNYLLMGNKSLAGEAVKAKTYLIEHNILERRSSVSKGTKQASVTHAETAEAEYNSVFVDSYNDYYSMDVNTKSDAVSKMNQFIQKVQTEMLDGALSDGDFITDNVKNKITKQLKKYKNSFAKAVKGSSDVKVVYTKYLQDVKRYYSAYRVGLRTCNGDNIKKSDFLVLLSKTEYGAQMSRPIIFNTSSYRTGRQYSKTTPDYWNGLPVLKLKGYWDTSRLAGDAEFAGDIHFFVTSNVYEIYLADLLNRGIIYQDEFGTSKAATGFLEMYNGNIEKSEWFAGNGISNWGTNVLGYGYRINDTKETYLPKPVSFFKNESLTKMDVYQYVEDVLRTTEKDLTETEADIISYKFGVRYLQMYSGGEAKTLKYLIAKGILNFENQDEFLGLDNAATCEDAYVLLYRLHNKGARFDFSQLTLTDSDTYWQQKGYAEDVMSINNLESGFLLSNGSATREEEEGDGALANAGGLNMFFPIVRAAAKSEYLVERRLSTDVKWKYDSIPIENLCSGSVSHGDVESVKKKNIKYNGKTISVYEATFKVKAATEAGALSAVSARLTTQGNSTSTVQCITKISGIDGGAAYTVLSQKSLKQSFSNISVIEDKVLLNTKTGSQAILLPDLGYALVGNQVIRTADLIVENTGSGREVYYNLKVILALLDDAFLKKIGYDSGIYLMNKNLSEHEASVHCEYGDTGTQVHCGKVVVTQPMADRYGGDEDSIRKGDKLFYYRVDDITDGLSTITREFNVKHGSKSRSMFVVVDWSFAIPSVDVFAKENKIHKILADNEKLTNSQITQYLYTRPENSIVLQSWWDSNYLACNALANFMYGTENTEYVTSGYIVPQISILCKEDSSINDNQAGWVTALFKGFKVTTFGEKTGDEANAENYFGNGSDWSTWFSSYYNGANCFGWLKSAGKVSGDQYDDLVTTADRYKSCRVVTGYKSSKYNSMLFGDKFLRTEGGVLYRNLAQDTERVQYSVSNDKVKVVTITSRTDTFVTPKANTTIVQVGGDSEHKMLYKGTTEINGVTYYKLAPISNACVLNTASKLYNGGFVSYYTDGRLITENKPKFILDNGSGSVKDNSWKDVYQAWQKTYLGISTLPACVDYTNAFCYGAETYNAAKKQKVKFAWNYTIFQSNGKNASKMNAVNSVHTVGTTKAGSSEDAKGKRVKLENRVWVGPQAGAGGRRGSVSGGKANAAVSVFAVPMFYVQSDEYKFAENADYEKGTVELIESDNSTAIRYGNYYYTGVTKAVQNAIVAHYVDTKKLNEIGKGTQVSIGSLRFYVCSEGKGKDDVWVVSSALNLKNERKQLQRAAAAWRTSAKSQKALKSEVEKLFSGITIECDGAFYPIVNYIKDKKQDGLKSGIQLGELLESVQTSKYGLVFQKGNTAWGYKNKKSKKINSSNSTAYRYVRVKIKMSGELKVRPLDQDGRVWTLAPITITGNLGYGSDSLAFYEEDLSYDDNQYADLSTNTTRFNMSEAFRQAKAKFQRTYRAMWAGDIKSWILMVIILFSVYLCIMSWMAYLILHYGIMLNFIEAIAAGPYGRTGKGLDLLKLFTLGFYTLESTPPLHRVVVIQLGCAILAAIAYNMM